MTVRSLLVAMSLSLPLQAAGCAPSSGGPEASAAQGSAQAAPETPSVTMSQAREAALGQVPQGQIRSEELEHEGDRLVYSFDLTVPGQEGVEEVLVDAADGTIVSTEHESPQAEKAEAQAESAATGASDGGGTD